MTDIIETQPAAALGSILANRVMNESTLSAHTLWIIFNQTDSNISEAGT
jgi:hypothetical protein